MVNTNICRREVVSLHFSKFFSHILYILLLRGLFQKLTTFRLYLYKCADKIYA